MISITVRKVATVQLNQNLWMLRRWAEVFGPCGYGGLTRRTTAGDPFPPYPRALGLNPFRYETLRVNWLYLCHLSCSVPGRPPNGVGGIQGW